MRFKIDENLPIEVAILLRQAGHDAMTVAEQGLSGSSDSTLAALCQDEERAMLTLDLDFADIRTYPPAEYAGIVVLRLLRNDAPHIQAVVGRMLPLMKTEPLPGHLWIVDEQKVRIR
jgi:predicted nuclease of predicted toxin-antitoxin system